jgi:hypothetical protein
MYLLCLFALLAGSNENILRLCTEVIYELAQDASNQTAFFANNACDVFLNVLIQHSASAVLTSHICRAIQSLTSSKNSLSFHLLVPFTV